MQNLRRALFGMNPPANTVAARKSVVGTVPSHNSYTFLHSPFPPSKFPAKMRTTLSLALLSRVSTTGGLVNWSWSGRETIDASADYVELVDLDDSSAVYSATTFSVAGGRLEIPRVSLDNVEVVSKLIANHGTTRNASASTVDMSDADIYVCTHGARNCFCGSVGKEVVDTLRKEVARRNALDPSGPYSRLRIRETGHVSGHFEAANMLIYPHGEWLGLLHPGDVPSVLDSILNMISTPFSRERTAPLSPNHWRGRMGFTGSEQKALYSLFSPE